MICTAVEELDGTVLAPRDIPDGRIADTGSEIVEGQKIRLNNVGAARLNVYPEPHVGR